MTCLNKQTERLVLITIYLFLIDESKTTPFILKFNESHKPLIDFILLRNYSYIFVAFLEGYINLYSFNSETELPLKGQN